MSTSHITGVDFITTEICGLFQINTQNKNSEHREIWCMFNSIQNRPSLEGFVHRDLCTRIGIKMKNHMKSMLVISILSEKILCILDNHLKQKSISYDYAHQMVWRKLYEHKQIQLGEFM
ncbi:MAG: hypothetical protein KBC42_03680 [Candidatus Pacebacteria bacterium]|nr:hypothetical protein [Candidatus Paceibacterota bacterium]MBP9780996.1 hypothetical protein [Candidatus Paceibacterota bacterium]